MRRGEVEPRPFLFSTQPNPSRRAFANSAEEQPTQEQAIDANGVAAQLSRKGIADGQRLPLWSVDRNVPLLDLFPFDGVVNFLAMDGDLFRRLDAQTHLVTADFDHHDGDVITDDDLFVLLAAQYQHCFSLQRRTC